MSPLDATVDHPYAAARGLVAAIPRRRTHATDVSDAMRRIARVLKAHAPEYGAVIAQRIHERMPEFGDRKVTQLTRDAVAAAVAGFARMVLREETPDQLVVPAESLEYVRAFVHRNIDVELLVREYRLGHEELWRVCGQLVAE